MNIRRLAAITLLIIMLFVLPYFNEVPHIVLYYIGVGMLIIITIISSVLLWGEKLERRFYERWRRKRVRGFWVNVMTSTLYFFVTMVIIIGFSQYVVNDISLLQIGSQLSLFQLLILIALFITMSVIVGIVSWFENEKKFNQN